MSRLQTWDEQVAESKARANVRPTPAPAPAPPADDRAAVALERMARAQERIARRLGVIEWLLIGWTLFVMLFGLGFTIRGL